MLWQVLTIVDTLDCFRTPSLTDKSNVCSTQWALCIDAKKKDQNGIEQVSFIVD